MQLVAATATATHLHSLHIKSGYRLFPINIECLVLSIQETRCMNELYQRKSEFLNGNVSSMRIVGSINEFCAKVNKPFDLKFNAIMIRMIEDDRCVLRMPHAYCQNSDSASIIWNDRGSWFIRKYVPCKSLSIEWNSRDLALGKRLFHSLNSRSNIFELCSVWFGFVCFRAKSALKLSFIYEKLLQKQSWENALEA